jgi:hypothetical protein
MGSRHPRSLSGPTSPSAQNASTSSGSEMNATPLGFARDRLGGPPIQPGILPQFPTTSQTGPNLNVSAVRNRYRNLVPEQSSPGVTTPDISKYAGMSAAQISEQLRQLEKKREEDSIKRAEIESQSAPYQSTRAGRRLYNSLLEHRSPNTNSYTSFSSISSSLTTPDISKYVGMSAVQISERLKQLDLEKEKREQDFVGCAAIGSERTSALTGTNHPMFGRKGGEHPASRAYQLEKLPPEARVIPELQKWSVSEIKLQADLIKNRHTYSAPQNPPSYYAENPLFFIPTAGPSQPPQGSSTAQSPQSPPKQDNSDNTDDPDIIDY